MWVSSTHSVLSWTMLHLFCQRLSSAEEEGTRWVWSLVGCGYVSAIGVHKVTRACFIFLLSLHLSPTLPVPRLLGNVIRHFTTSDSRIVNVTQPPWSPTVTAAALSWNTIGLQWLVPSAFFSPSHTWSAHSSSDVPLSHLAYRALRIEVYSWAFFFESLNSSGSSELQDGVERQRNNNERKLGVRNIIR